MKGKPLPGSSLQLCGGGVERMAASSSFSPLVIDLSPFLTQPHQPVDEEARGRVVSQLQEAISGPGVFLLVGHGIAIGEQQGNQQGSHRQFRQRRPSRPV